MNTTSQQADSVSLIERLAGVIDDFDIATAGVSACNLPDAKQKLEAALVVLRYAFEA